MNSLMLSCLSMEVFKTKLNLIHRNGFNQW